MVHRGIGIKVSTACVHGIVLLCFINRSLGFIPQDTKSIIMSSSSKNGSEWVDQPEGGKKEVDRVRSVENCKKNRKKWKESDETIKALFESNEKRIRDLESMVHNFSKELDNGKRSKRSSGPSSQSSRNWLDSH